MAALYHLEGFDHFEIKTDSPYTASWDTIPATVAWRHTTTEAAARSSATAPATAKKRGLVLATSGATSAAHRRYIMPDQAEVGATIAFGFDINLSSGNPPGEARLIALQTAGLLGTTQLSVFVTTSGELKVTRSTTTELVTSSALATNTWYHIDVKVLIDDSVGTAEIKIDGVSDDTASGVDTQAHASNTTVNAFAFYSLVTGATYIDNFYIANDYCESLRVDTFMPTADGAHNADFTKSGGSTQYELLDDYSAIDGDGTYLQSATVNHEYSQTFPTQATGQTIYGLAVANVFENPDGGTIAAKPLIRVSSTDYLGNDEVTAPTGYKRTGEVFNNDPSDAATWTDTKINATEFGLKITS